MRHILLAGMAASVASSSALAFTPKFDTSNMITIPQENISREAIPGISPSGVEATPRGSSTDFVVSYSAMTGFLSSQTFGQFEFRVDDYVKDPAFGSSLPNGNKQHSLRFVGGVAEAGQGIQFFFLDSNGITLNSFTTTLGTAGNFIWTLDLPETNLKDDAGFFAIQAPSGSTLTWFLTDTADLGFTETTGANDGEFATSAFAFELRNLPAPGAAALFGFAGLAASRRKRS